MFTLIRRPERVTFREGDFLKEGVVFLNDSIIRNAKPGPKLRTLKDGDGLFLLVQEVTGVGECYHFVEDCSASNKPMEPTR